MFDFPKAKHVRLVALGIGDYMKFIDQLREIAGDNIYTADNFDELSDLFNEILVETCSKYEHEWKFGRTRNAVRTRAAGECFHSFSSSTKLSRVFP